MALKLGGLYMKRIDLGWIEYLGGQGIYNFLTFNRINIQLVQMKNLFVIMYIYLLIIIGVYSILYYLNSLYSRA